MLPYIAHSSLSWDPFLPRIVMGALLQAVLSTFLTLGLALLGAWGLLSLQTRWLGRRRVGLHSLFILPSFLPPILCVTLSSGALGFLPRGLWGVVFFHCLMNVGLATLLVATLYKRVLPQALRDCQVFGIPPWRAWWQALFPQLKMGLFVLASYFFVLYFLSFSIPLLVGGALYGGIEVFIYEKILYEGEWAQAYMYVLLFSLALFLLSQWLPSPAFWQHDSVELSSSLLKGYEHRAWMFLTLVPSFFFILTILWVLMKSPLAGWEGLAWSSVRASLLMSLFTGLCVFVLLSLVSLSFLSRRFIQVLMSLVSPSWVLVGFSFLLMGFDGQGGDFVKLALALTIVYTPYLFRLSFASRLLELREQVQLASTFPVSWWHIFIKVIYPQLIHGICFLSGLAALWACGDFAMSEILLGGHNSSTLALDIKNLLDNYQMESALALLFPLLLTSFAVFFLFQGLAYVCCRNFPSRLRLL